MARPGTFVVPVDFSDVEEFELIPAGVYSAVVEGLDFIEAKDEDHYPQLKVTYTLTEDGELQGKKVSQWLSFSPKSTFWMKQFFDAFQVELSQLVVDEDTNVVTEPDLSDAVVTIKVLVVPHYQDRTRKVNKIDAAPVVKSVPGRKVTPAAEEKASVRPGRRVIS